MLSALPQKLIITQKPSSPKKARKMSRASLAMQSPDLIGNLPGAKSNLWSLKARQDIFERRQNGEDWETICKVRMKTKRVPSRPKLIFSRTIQRAHDMPCNNSTRWAQSHVSRARYLADHATGYEETERSGKNKNDVWLVDLEIANSSIIG